MVLGYWPLMRVDEAKARYGGLAGMSCWSDTQQGDSSSAAESEGCIGAYCEVKKIKPSSRKRYDSLTRTHFGDWMDRSVVDREGRGSLSIAMSLLRPKGQPWLKWVTVSSLR